MAEELTAVLEALEVFDFKLANRQCRLCKVFFHSTHKHLHHH